MKHTERESNFELLRIYGAVLVHVHLPAIVYVISVYELLFK